MTRKARKNKGSRSSFMNLSTDGKLETLFDTVTKGFEDTNKNVKDLQEKLEGKIVKIEKRVKKIESDQDIIDKQVQVLQTEINTLKQDKLACDLIIRGVPTDVATDEQTLLTLVQLMITQTKCTTPYNITAVYRLGRRNSGDNNTSTPIMVQFSHQTERDSVLTAKKQVKLNCAQIQCDGKPIGPATQNIYFEERLTRENSEIYYQARLLRKRLLIKHAWVRGGSILIRVNDNDKAVAITDADQLKKYEKRKMALSSTLIDKNNDANQDVDMESDDSSSDESAPSPVLKAQRTSKEVAGGKPGRPRR